jgi:hypothetical protein
MHESIVDVVLLLDVGVIHGNDLARNFVVSAVVLVGAVLIFSGVVAKIVVI